MAKKAATTHMNHAERLAGTIFFIVYLLVMPLLLDKIFSFAEVMLDTSLGASLRCALYYYVLFAATVLIFHSFIALTTTRLFDGLNRSLGSLFLSLLVFYGANELFYRVLNFFFGSRVNLNDTTIAAQVSAAPRTTVLIVVFLAPFVEEVLFRGLVFGCVKEKSRVVAYALSALLFAFAYAWTFAAAPWSLSGALLLAQYLVPGLVFAWAFDRSGTLWTSIALHIIVNALALYVI